MVGLFTLESDTRSPLVESILFGVVDPQTNDLRERFDRIETKVEGVLLALVPIIALAC